MANVKATIEDNKIEGENVSIEVDAELRPNTNSTVKVLNNKGVKKVKFTRKAPRNTRTTIKVVES